MAEEKKEVNPQAPAAEAAVPEKVDGRKKGGDQPKVMPFQLVSPATKARLLEIGPANEATLLKLLDVYAQRESASAGAREEENTEMENLRQESLRLAQELKQANESITRNVAKQQSLEQELEQFRKAVPADQEANTQKIAALEKKISDSEQEISRLNTELDEAKKKPASGNTDTAHLQEIITELKKKLDAANEKNTENGNALNSYASMKEAADKQIDELKKELKTIKSSYVNLERTAEEPITNRYPEGNILHFFPELTAKFLDETCKRLTACRKDGLIVTPQKLLGDMFNRYTVDQLNLWFYRWVLTDKELVEMAHVMEPKIESKRMLRAALGIR